MIQLNLRLLLLARFSDKLQYLITPFGILACPLFVSLSIDYCCYTSSDSSVTID